MLLSSIAIITVSAQRSSANAIDKLWRDSATQLLSRVVLHVRNIYEPGARTVQFSERSVQNGQINPTDTPALFEHLEATIDAFPSIVWASFADDTGTYVSVYRWPVDDAWEIRRTRRILEYPETGERTWFYEERRENGIWVEIRNERTSPYDPRKKPWFHKAKAGPRGVGQWHDPLLFHSRKQLGLHYSMPSYDPDTDEFVGVWTAEFEAAPVVDYLANLETQPGTKIYIVDEDGIIVSRPSGSLVAKDSLLTAESAGDPLLAETFRLINSEQTAPGVVFETGEEVAMFQRMPETSGLPWYVIATVPKEQLFSETQAQATFAFGMGLVGILLSILLTLGAATTLTRVVKRKVDDAVDTAVETAIRKTKVGQYTLESKLGAGGMGEVFVASHAMLRRPTAVKLLKPGFGTPEDIERFEHEVQMTCRLTHPNTITIFDYGRTANGRFYYAMELVDGVTLRDLVAFTGPLPAGRILYLADQICGALIEAHGTGLVHRDIKPPNILVARVGGLGDFIKLLDFGLVKDVEMDEGDDTVSGSFSGTPGFLAPEVATEPDKVGPVTDLYSVGAVMYVLLTAKLPFEGESAMGVFIEQQTNDPVPPSVRRSDLHIPDDLEAVIMRCLSRDPTARPADAASLRLLLKRCRDVGGWTQADANLWWTEHGDALRATGAKRSELPEATTLVAETRET